MNQRIARRTRGIAAAITVAASLLAAAPAIADYKIVAGDILSFSIAGMPELAAKAPVDIDGNATLPLLGPVPVAGLSISQALAKVQSVLPGKEFRRRADDGREFPVIVQPDEIGLSVAEYRPVYVNGDVAKPGEEPFRPGLTVRKAVALAGGYDILRFKMDNPFLQLSDLVSEYNVLWIAYAKQQATIARIQAELDGKNAIDPKLVMSTPITPTLAKDILGNESSLLDVRDADFAKEQTYLRDAASKEGDRAKILNQQLSEEMAGVKADQADLQRYTDLYNRGAVALPGLSDARRTELLSSTRALQTTALLDSVEREQQDLSRKLERTSDTRRMDLIKEQQDATVTLADTRAKLQAVSEKLRYTGMVKSQLVRDGGTSPKVTILRTLDGHPQNIEAGIDTALEPGDTVEVALQAEQPVPATQ